MKIAVYTIALDEEHHVERYLASVAEADLISVTDTGSTDRTVDALRAGGATVHEISVRPFRFDVARNASLALLPADVDVCLALDLDEVPEPGWRERLEAGWGSATRGRYVTVLTHHPDGSDGTTMWAHKIHSRHGYRWVYPCNELLVPDRIEESTAWLDLRVHHLPDGAKSREQYLDALVLSCAEMPHDPKPAFHLARHYWSRQMWSEAEEALHRYLDFPDATERAESMRMLGDVCGQLGRAEDALRWWRCAVAEAPGLREPWVSLARALATRSDWAGCLSAARNAMAVDDRIGTYRPSWAWGDEPLRLARLAEQQLGARPGDDA